MNNQTSHLLNRRKKLLDIQQSLQNYLQKNPNDNQQIRISRSHGYPQYYLVSSNTAPNGTYIKKKNLSIASKILQTDYYLELLDNINQELSSIDNFLKHCPATPYENIYSSLDVAKQKLVKPIIDTDEVFLKKWINEHPDYLNTYPFPGNCFTNDNREVRSKSEILIANALIKYSVPFRYECKLIANNRNYYPDFTCLNMRTRKTWIWDHAGLLSSPQYAADLCERVDVYEKYGYYFGDGLISTFECHDNSINTKTIDYYINRYLL